MSLINSAEFSRFEALLDEVAEVDDEIKFKSLLEITCSSFIPLENLELCHELEICGVGACSYDSSIGSGFIDYRL